MQLVAFPYSRKEAKETQLFRVSKEHSSKTKSLSWNLKIRAFVQIFQPGDHFPWVERSFRPEK